MAAIGNEEWKPRDSLKGNHQLDGLWGHSKSHSLRTSSFNSWSRIAGLEGAVSHFTLEDQEAQIQAANPKHHVGFFFETWGTSGPKTGHRNPPFSRFRWLLNMPPRRVFAGYLS